MNKQEEYAEFRNAFLEKHGIKGHVAVQLLRLRYSNMQDIEIAEDVAITLLGLLCDEKGWDADEIIALSDELHSQTSIAFENFKQMIQLLTTKAEGSA